MKKMRDFLLFASVFLAFSCSNDFGIPEKIYVKTNAQYNYSIGNFTQDLAEYLSVDTLKDNITSSGTNMKFYDYNPGARSSVQQYLLDMPVSEIPIDFGSYLENMDFTESLKNMSFDQKITVPDISIGTLGTQKIDLPDINGKIRSAASISGGTVPLPGSGTIPSASVPVSISNPSFSTISFSGGSLRVTIAASGSVPSGMTANVKLSLPKANGGTSSGTIVVKGPNSAYADIPLSGVELSSSFNITVSGSTSGGSSVYSYSLAFSFTEDMKVQKITGLTMDLGSDGNIAVDKSIEVTAQDTFVECSIDTGHLSIKSLLPDGWENVGITSSVAFSGGLTASDSQIAAGTADGKSYIINRYMDLAGKTYKKGNIRVTGNVGFTLNNATLVLGNLSSIDLNIDCSISKMSTVTVDLASMKDSLLLSTTESLPASMKDSLQYITLTESGFTADYENGLPDGNDITVSVYSDFIGLGSQVSPKTGVMEAAKSGSLDFKTTSETTIDPSVKTAVDFSVRLVLPGSTDEHPYYAVLSNIEVGKSYRLKVDVTPVFDWKEVGLNASYLGSSNALTDSIDTGFNISSIFAELTKVLQDDSIIQKIQFCEVPVYMYAEAPGLDVFENLKFKGSMTATVGSGTPVTLMDGTSGSGIAPVKESIVLEKNSNDVVISDLENVPYSFKTDLKDLVNSNSVSSGTADSLVIDYNFEIDTGKSGVIVIEKDDFDKITGSSTSIKLSARIALVLNIEFTDDISLDVMKLGGFADRTDLFERDGPTDTSDYDKYIDIIQKMLVIYSVNNNLLRYQDHLTAGTISFVSTSPAIDKTMYLSSGSFEFETEEFRQILKVSNFMPTIMLNAPKGKVFVPRNASIGMNAAVRIYASGKVSVWEA
ncbi:MAG: hypothetical protein UHO11_00395 [Treponema sp.]|nr:hypothetical protein [Treponema sp.]